MSKDDGTIVCQQHGAQHAAFVCQHLLDGRDKGFHQGFDPEEPDALFPDAWCTACENLREAEGGWNEHSATLAEISVICSVCYRKARLLNWPRSTHGESAELVRQSLEYLRDRQDALNSRFRLDDHERYDWCQESGQLVLSNAGTPAVVADIQFVGSVSTRTSTWMWSWANESFLEAARDRVRRVRAYGDEHGLLRLACACWQAEEEDGWQMTAVSAYLLEAEGAYRSPDDDGFTFMVLTGVAWAQ